MYRCTESLYSYPALVTPTVGALVWVVGFGIDTSVLDDELKSVIHKTTIATLVLLCIAVYKLLLREGDQFSGDNLVDSLHRPNCGERPATSCNMKENIVRKNPMKTDWLHTRQPKHMSTI